MTKSKRVASWKLISSVIFNIIFYMNITFNLPLTCNKL